MHIQKHVGIRMPNIREHDSLPALRLPFKVKGDSMIEEGISDGDWVTIEQRNHACNGEIVVALVNNTDVTLSFIEQYPDEILLIPANSGMEAVSYHSAQIEIQGVVVSVAPLKSKRAAQRLSRLGALLAELDCF